MNSFVFYLLGIRFDNDLISGHYPVVSIDRKVLKPVKCPPTHFQPNGQMSNEYKKIKCSYMKSVCNDDGEEDCSDGNNVEDRTCRCDYTMGYRASVYFVKNPLNKACFQPSAVDNGCIMFNCSEGKELNPGMGILQLCIYFTLLSLWFLRLHAGV